MKKQEHNEELLFPALLAGNKKAYELFFLKYYNTLCAYGNQFVSQIDSEEIVQDVMVMLWEKRKQIDSDGNPLGYLFRSVKNRCLKKLIRDQLHASINNELYDSVGVNDPDFYVAEELSAKIEASLSKMPESYREAFEMNRYKKMTYQQIADELNISSKTVDYRIRKALQQLRTDLKDYLPLVGFLFIP